MRKLYLRAKNKWITVSDEVYKSYRLKCNSYRITQKNNGRCVCPRKKFYLCDMDCWTCIYRRAGNITSLDDENGIHSIPDSENCIDEIITYRLILNLLLQRLDEVMPEARFIGNCRLLGKTDEEIASELHIPFFILIDQAVSQKSLHALFESLLFLFGRFQPVQQELRKNSDDAAGSQYRDD